MICDKCQYEFDPKEARRCVDREFGKGRYDKLTQYGTHFCEACAIDELEMLDEDGNRVDPKDIWYPD